MHYHLDHRQAVPADAAGAGVFPEKWTTKEAPASTVPRASPPPPAATTPPPALTTPPPASMAPPPAEAVANVPIHEEKPAAELPDPQVADGFATVASPEGETGKS